MARKEENLAYDLSLFEARPKELERKEKQTNVVTIPKEKLAKNQKRKIRPFTLISTFLLSMTVIATVSVMIYSQVELTELTEQINVTTKQLQEQQSIYTQLQMKAESELSLRAVEDYAKTNLAMKKIEPSQVEYINLSEGDKAEIKQDPDKRGILDTIEDLISSFVS